MFFVGGMSAVAARRAARFGLPFYPPMPMPDLEQVYYSELRKSGKQGFVYSPRQGNKMTFLHEDPRSAWQRYARYLLNETREYSSWKHAGIPRPSEEEASTVEELQNQGRYEILTPQQCIEAVRGGRRTLVFHPLVGGLPLEESWRSLRLFADAVRPALP